MTQCPQCKEFFPTRGNKKFCCRACHNLWWQAKRKELNETLDRLSGLLREMKEDKICTPS
jgi:hypothetical protein